MLYFYYINRCIKKENRLHLISFNSKPCVLLYHRTYKWINA